jgi:hypothetical protein
VTAVAEHQVADDDQTPAIPQGLENPIDRAAQRRAFTRTPKTDCNIKSVYVTYNRLRDAISQADMPRG